MKENTESSPTIIINNYKERTKEIKDRLKDLKYNLTEINNMEELSSIAEKGSLPDIIITSSNNLLDLEKSNRVKNNLLSQISHDLRSPIGTIKMMLELLEQKVISADSPDYDTIIKDLVNTSTDVFALLENLLYWSRIQFKTVSYVPSNQNLKSLTDKAISQLKRSIDEKKIHILNNIVSEETIWVDEFLIPIILKNLISNGCKYSDENAEILIKEEKEGNKIHIIIEDKGIGISEENLKKIKDPDILFHTSGTNGEQGNGLGLKICYELSIINKGTLKIESKEKEGTKVILTLPSVEK